MPGKPRHPCWWVIFLASLSVLAACSSSGGDAATSPLPPTHTLIPATATPVPATPAPTPTDLPAPATLAALATPASTSPLPAEIERLMEITTADMIGHYSVAADTIRLIALETFTWPDSNLGCGSIAGEDTVEPAETPGYRIIYSVSPHIFVYHTDFEAHFVLCEDRAWLTQEGTPVQFDPIASAMVELAARDAARWLDVPEDDITLASLITVDWPDTSLGCPKPDIDYDSTTTTGYRILFRSGAQTALYHASIRDYVRCTPDEEILPGSLRRALPTATPDEQETPEPGDS